MPRIADDKNGPRTELMSTASTVDCGLYLGAIDSLITSGYPELARSAGSAQSFYSFREAIARQCAEFKTPRSPEEHGPSQ